MIPLLTTINPLNAMWGEEESNDSISVSGKCEAASRSLELGDHFDEKYLVCRSSACTKPEMDKNRTTNQQAPKKLLIEHNGRRESSNIRIEPRVQILPQFNTDSVPSIHNPTDVPDSSVEGGDLDDVPTIDFVLRTSQDSPLFNIENLEAYIKNLEADLPAFDISSGRQSQSPIQRNLDTIREDSEEEESKCFDCNLIQMHLRGNNQKLPKKAVNQRRKQQSQSPIRSRPLSNPTENWSNEAQSNNRIWRLVCCFIL